VPTLLAHNTVAAEDTELWRPPGGVDGEPSGGEQDVSTPDDGSLVSGSEPDQWPDMLWRPYSGGPRREGGSAAATYSLSRDIDATLQRLASEGIIVRHRDRLREYMLRHPDIVSLVPYVGGLALCEFASRAQISLELYRDPEISDEHVVIYVRQAEYEDNLLGEIEAIQAVYSHKLAQRRGWLLLTTDFQPPD
jgi:hypothetical protein